MWELGRGREEEKIRRGWTEALKGRQKGLRKGHK
jgi:hypothetical protein